MSQQRPTAFRPAAPSAAPSVDGLDVPRIPLPPAADPVHVEMFRAIELLGRKLERVEGERAELASRLSRMESATQVDARTGKIFLPVAVSAGAQAGENTAPLPSRWLVAASMVSMALALFAATFVLLQEPAGPRLTPRQIAALNTLTAINLVSGDATASPLSRFASLPKAATAASVSADDNKAITAQMLPAPTEEVFVSTHAPLADETVAEVTPAAASLPAAATELPVVAADTVVTAVMAPLPPAPATGTPPAAPPVVAQAVKPAPRTAPVNNTAMSPDSNLPPPLKSLEARAFDNMPEAQHDLAVIYAAGKMMRQDYRRAAYWFARAADGGVANAHYNLGVMYQQGLGTRADAARAVRWYETAAELGHAEAMYNLGLLYVGGEGVARNVDRGMAFFRRAANAGMTQAAYNLGVLYENGAAGTVSAARAAEWYAVAAGEGHEQAQTALARVETLNRLSRIAPAAGE